MNPAKPINSFEKTQPEVMQPFPRLPEHWALRKLRHVSTLIVSNVDKHSHDNEQPVRLCNYVDVYRNEFITASLPFMRATATFDEIEQFRLKLDDVIITKDSELWSDIGEPALVRYAAEDLICGYHLAILRPRHSQLSGEYLLRCLQVPYVAVQLHVAANGITRYGLAQTAIKDCLISLPPLAEQDAIVRFIRYLDHRVNRLIKAKRRLIALLNEQKQAIINHAITRGLDLTVPLKPSGIDWLSSIPAHWRVSPLKAVCEIQSGITLGKNYTGQILSEYPYLRVANVQAGHADLAVVKTIQVTKAEALRSTLKKGDVLMTEGGDPDKLGRGCVWDAQITPCLHQNHIFAVRPNQSHLAPHYLSALMGTSYARAYFQSTAKQTTNLAATNKNKIGQFKVLLPTVDEQKRILEALDEETRPANIAISRLEREISLIREYRTRLVSDVVTGQLDVRHLDLPDVEEEPVDLAGEGDDVDELAGDDGLAGEELAEAAL